jgi:hypothetical protein
MTVTDTYTITYTARTITYTLSGVDATTGLTIQYLGDQGFGLAPLHRITTRGPLQDGDSDIDFRLDPRVMQLPLVVMNTDARPRYQHYEIREKLLQIFRPGDNATITVTRNNGTTTKTRRINVKVLGGLSFDVDPNGYHVRTVVQLRASDPTWFDPNNQQFIYTSAFIGSTRTITTTGNWNVFPYDIGITGPITNAKITNNTTGQFIEFTGTISAGTSYLINLSYGVKTVVDNLGANQISKVTPASNLATWSLLPGNNVIAVTGTGTTVATQVSFNFNDRFTGI